jgi:hypothetical protein
MRTVSYKSLEKIKKYIVYSINFFLDNRAFCEILWKNNVEPDRPQMTIWHTCTACWITKATDKHSEDVILTAFPLQPWLHESASMLSYTYIRCVVTSYTTSYVSLSLSLSLCLSVSSVVFLEYYYFTSRFPVTVNIGLRQRRHRITGSTPIRLLMFIHRCWRHPLS